MIDQINQQWRLNEFRCSKHPEGARNDRADSRPTPAVTRTALAESGLHVNPPKSLHEWSPRLIDHLADGNGLAACPTTRGIRSREVRGILAARDRRASLTLGDARELP